MKVSSAPSQSSALDTWLHDSAAIEASASAAASRSAGSAGGLGSPSGRDSAEGLLGLPVWDSSAGHRLVTPISAPESAASAAQVWAAHIFAPLV